jgi:hypothetical protein
MGQRDRYLLNSFFLHMRKNVYFCTVIAELFGFDKGLYLF